MAKLKVKPKPAATIADRIKATIAAKGLSAGEVGRLAGVDRAIVSRFLAGDRDLYLATADRIASALGLRLK